VPKTLSENCSVKVENRKVFLLGANYWNRKHDILMWRKWDRETVKDDLKKAREIGLKVLRAFILAEDFAETDGSLKEDSARKLEEFLNIAQENGLIIFLTLLVGHMSGKNWGFPWDSENKVYEVDVLEKTRKFVREVVRRFKNHPALGGWIISNEITLVAKPEKPEQFYNWLRTLYRDIKEEDSHHIVSLGDSTTPFSTLLTPEKVEPYVDYFSPHLYLYDDNPIRHTMTYLAVLEYCRSLKKKPVILEEYGFPTNLYTEESHARFIEIVLVGALAVGASGAFIWCFSDFPGEEDEPYLWEPHELAFGLIKANGENKKAAESVKRVSELLEILDLNQYTLPQRDIEIVVPAVLYRDYPFVFENNYEVFKALSQAYVLAEQASLQATFVREDDIESSESKVIVVPSLPRLLTRTWRKLLKLAEKGRLVYYSHLRYTNHPHVSSCHIWEELFGVQPSLKAGMRAETLDYLYIRFDDWVLRIPEVKRDLGSTGFVPVDAKPIGFAYRKPVFFEASRGSGYTMLSAHPIELHLAYTSIHNNAYKLYEKLASKVGVKPFYKADNPAIQVKYWLKKGEPKILFLLNHSYTPLKTRLTGKIIWGRGEKEDNLIKIEPKSAVVLEL